MFQSGLFVSGISTVWEDTDGCAKKYICALDIYSINVLSYLYSIIMDLAINPNGHGNIVFFLLNATGKNI